MHDKRVALVTGANKGIGPQIAKDYALIGKAENMPVSAHGGGKSNHLSSLNGYSPL